MDAVIDRVGLDRERVRQVLAAAERSRYFDDKPRFADCSIPEADLRTTAAHLSDFSGVGGWSVTYESLKSFVEQFPPRFRDTLVRLVASFDVLSQSSLVVTLRKLLLQHAESSVRNRYIVGLSPDSGSLIRVSSEYELRESLNSSGWSFKKTIRDALETVGEGDELVLIDDNITSGNQAICQFMAWLEVPRDQWSPEQQLEQGIEMSPLSMRDQDVLKEVQITIVSAVGTPEGKQNLAESLPAHGLKGYQGLVYDREMAREARNLEDLSDFLKDVGSHLISWVRYGKDNLAELTEDQQARCEKDALGYDGASALVCTGINVLAGTVIAFWCPGIYRGEAWMPLLIRRGYLKHLVLA